MDYTTFFLVLFGLQAVCLYVGSKTSEDLNNQDDYFFAGKGLKFWPLMMTFLATQVGGCLILGAAEESYKYGWTVLLYPGGQALGLVLLGLGIGRRLASFKVNTVAQIFEVAYGSPVLKKIASVLSVVTLFMLFVAQIVGSSKLMVSLGVENPVWFFAFWAIVIFYTAVGGLKAVVATDLIQAAFFIVVFMFCAGYVLWNEASFLGGFNSESFAFEPTKLSGWLLMPLLFMAIEQDMAQRCFAADSPRTVSKATFWAGIATFTLGVIPVMLGVLGKASGVNVPERGSVLLETIMQLTNPVITAFVGCAILAAIISTADSLINAIGSNLSQDFGFSLFNDKNVRASQLVSVGIALLGIVVSFSVTNIVDFMILSYELSVSALFVPIFIAIFRRKGTFLSALFSLIAGAAAFILFKWVPTAWPKEILTMLISLGGFIIGEYLPLSKKAKPTEACM